MLTGRLVLTLRLLLLVHLWFVPVARGDYNQTVWSGTGANGPTGDGWTTVTENGSISGCPSPPWTHQKVFAVGSTYTVPFTGTAFYLMVLAAPDRGIFQVNIDNDSPVGMDGSIGNTNAHCSIVFSKTGLGNRPHTMYIKTLSTGSNGLSSEFDFVSLLVTVTGDNPNPNPDPTTTPVVIPPTTTAPTAITTPNPPSNTAVSTSGPSTPGPSNSASNAIPGTLSGASVSGSAISQSGQPSGTGSVGDVVGAQTVSTPDPHSSGSPGGAADPNNGASATTGDLPSNKLSTAALAGIIVGICLFLLLIIALLFFIRRRRIQQHTLAHNAAHPFASSDTQNLEMTEQHHEDDDRGLFVAHPHAGTSKARLIAAEAADRSPPPPLSTRTPSTSHSSSSARLGHTGSRRTRRPTVDRGDEVSSNAYSSSRSPGSISTTFPADATSPGGSSAVISPASPPAGQDLFTALASGAGVDSGTQQRVLTEADIDRIVVRLASTITGAPALTAPAAGGTNPFFPPAYSA